jgi:hypothetical protein
MKSWWPRGKRAHICSHSTDFVNIFGKEFDFSGCCRAEDRHSHWPQRSSLEANKVVSCHWQDTWMNHRCQMLQRHLHSTSSHEKKGSWMSARMNRSGKCCYDKQWASGGRLDWYLRALQSILPHSTLERRTHSSECLRKNNRKTWKVSPLHQHQHIGQVSPRFGCFPI